MAQPNDRTETKIHILARVKAEERGWLAITYDLKTHQYSASSIVGWALAFKCPEAVAPANIYMFKARTVMPFGPDRSYAEWLPEDEWAEVVEYPVAYLPPENIRVGEYGRLRTNEERLASYVAADEEYTTDRIQSIRQSIRNKGDRQ